MSTSAISCARLPISKKKSHHLVEKLRKRLQVFRPELLHLKGVVEQSSPREGTNSVAEPASAFRSDGGAALGANAGGGHQKRL